MRECVVLAETFNISTVSFQTVKIMRNTRLDGDYENIHLHQFESLVDPQILIFTDEKGKKRNILEHSKA